jgi:hypothetical protein
MNTAMHEIDGRLAMRRVEQESKARQVLSGNPSFRIPMLVIMVLILVVSSVGLFIDTKTVALGALLLASEVAGLLWSMNRRLEAAIALLKLRDEMSRDRPDGSRPWAPAHD